MSNRAITPEDEGTLTHYLAVCSSYDLHGAVGLMHAVASSPALIPFSAWHPLVQRDDRFTELRHLLGLASSTIANELGRRRPFPPPAGDPAACASFARGYLDGLELWPAWVPTVDRLRCASWACALGDRLDRLPASDRAQFRLTTDGRAALRREIGRFMMLTYDLYALDRPNLPTAFGGSRHHEV